MDADYYFESLKTLISKGDNNFVNMKMQLIYINGHLKMVSIKDLKKKETEKEIF